MSGVRFFMFIIALPALACLGHDLYMFYQNGMVEFAFSSAGFLWTHYSPETWQWAKDSTSPEHWEIVEFILQQKAFYVGLGFSIVIYFLLGILQLFRIWPFNRDKNSPFSSNSRVNDILNRADNKKTKL